MGKDLDCVRRPGWGLLDDALVRVVHHRYLRLSSEREMVHMRTCRRQKGLKGIAAMLALAGSVLCVTPARAASKWQQAEPDYTKGEVLLGMRGDKNGTRYWSLGPIGAEGNIWTPGRDTAKTRTIQIRTVMKGTPADGVLEQHDVILGVQSPSVLPDRDVQSEKDLSVDAKCGRPGCKGIRGSCGHFAWDVRKALAAAVAAAEKIENGGKLVLNIWRPVTEVGEVTTKVGKKEVKEKGLVVKKPISGKEMQVTITLPVRGTFGAASPWECEKTRAIVDGAAQALVKRGFFEQSTRKGRIARKGLDTLMDALGLLATGEEKYLPVVQEYARAIAKTVEGLDIMKGGMSSWNGGYTNLLLTEYYLVSKDEKVMPGIKALSTYLAKGRSGVGTFSHGMSYVKFYGLYGPPSAYGAMNQCSITCVMSLALAQKCGLRTKEIDDAVRIGTDFLRWYVDKGTIPYGDHDPAYYHDNNGRNSQAAVLFDLVGDKVSAKYFARQAMASFNVREVGHTGHFFATQWGALGAARGGPAAAQSFMRNMRWYTELERRPDGSYVFQRQLDTFERAYLGWSTTGQRLTQLCLPRKALYITGKGGSSFPTLTPDEVQEAAEAGRLNHNTRETNKAILEKYSVKELLDALGSWSLIVRAEAARELGTREENVVKELIAMLKGHDRYARYGACMGLKYAGRKSEEAVDVLIDKVTNDKDMTLRYYAVQALSLIPKHQSSEYVNGLGDVPRKAMPALLKLAALDDPEQDPTGKMTRILAGLFFNGSSGFFPKGKGIQNVDRALLIPALKAMLGNTNGYCRTTASSVYDDLSEDDLKQLWGDIYYATRFPAPSGSMAADGVRVAGVRILAEHRTREGLELGGKHILGIPDKMWGTYGRLSGTIPAVQVYGQGVKEYFPVIESFIARVRKEAAKNGRAKKTLRILEDAYEQMKTTPMPQDLKSIRPYIEAYEKEKEKKEK